MSPSLIWIMKILIGTDETMEMIKRTLLCAALFSFAASCAEIDNSNEQADIPGYFKAGEKVTITVNSSVKDATKVASSIGEGGKVSFTWEDNDQIIVKVGQETSTFTIKEGIGEGSAKFEGEMPGEGSTFSVQYPVSHPDLSNQTYNNVGIPDDMMLFTAASCTLTSDISLDPQYSVLSLKLYGEGKNVSKIIVTNLNDSKQYTLNCGYDVALGDQPESAIQFQIVVPASETPWRFSAKALDANGTALCALAPASAKTFTAGKIVGMQAAEVKLPTYPGTEYSGIAIGSTIWAPVNCGYDSDHKYGLMYQWGRKYGICYPPDETPTSVVQYLGNSPLTSHPDTGSSSNIYYNTWSGFWYNGSDINEIWKDGSKGTFDPCPAGWRISSYDELNALVQNRPDNMETCDVAPHDVQGVKRNVQIYIS